MVAVLPEPVPEFLMSPETARRYWTSPLVPTAQQKRNEGHYTARSTPRPAPRTVEDYTANPLHSLYVPSFTAPDPTPEPYSGGGGDFGGGGASGSWDSESSSSCDSGSSFGGGGDSGGGSCGSD